MPVRKHDRTRGHIIRRYVTSTLAPRCNSFFRGELSGHPVHQVSVVWNVAADIGAYKRGSERWNKTISLCVNTPRRARSLARPTRAAMPAVLSCAHIAIRSIAKAHSDVRG